LPLVLAVCSRCASTHRRVTSRRNLDPDHRSVLTMARSRSARSAHRASVAHGSRAREARRRAPREGGGVGTLVFSPSMALSGDARVLHRAARAWATPRAVQSDLDLALDRVAARYAAKGSRGVPLVRSKLAGDRSRVLAELGPRKRSATSLMPGAVEGSSACCSSCRRLRPRDRLRLDEKKLAIATRAAEGLPATFGRRTSVSQPRAVRHGAPHRRAALPHGREQDAVLRNVARAARRLVVVRSSTRTRGGAP